MRFGLDASGAPALETLQDIEAADRAGVGAVWLTSGAGAEQLALLSAAATRTGSIRLGTAIVPTFPRHPVLAVQGTAVVDALAPGRFRLGLGPSHEPIMHGMLGLRFDKPLEHLREYVQAVRQAFDTGKIDLDGKHFAIHMAGLAKSTVPVMISTLRPGAFRLAGEIADGALAWNCPAYYLAGEAVTALRAGAAAHNRPAPPLIAHCYVCPTSDAGEARRAARQRLAFYNSLPFYNKMWEVAGAHSVASGDVSDAFVDGLVAHGSADACLEKLRTFGRAAGAHEVIVSLLVPDSSDRRRTVTAAIDLLAALEKAGTPASNLIA